MNIIYNKLKKFIKLVNHLKKVVIMSDEIWLQMWLSFLFHMKRAYISVHGHEEHKWFSEYKSIFTNFYSKFGQGFKIRMGSVEMRTTALLNSSWYSIKSFINKLQIYSHMNRQTSKDIHFRKSLLKSSGHGNRNFTETSKKKVTSDGTHPCQTK